MPAYPSSIPATLGKITVTAAGTPERLAKNFPDFDTAAEATANSRSGRIAARTLFVQALPTNTDNVFLGGAELNKTTGADVVAELLPGQVISITLDHGVNGINIFHWFVDANVNGEGIYASFLQA